MRSPEEIHSMIEYLRARGEHQSDIAILKWVLDKDKSEAERKHSVEMEEVKVAMKGWEDTVSRLQARNAELETEVRRLKQLVVKGATVVRIPQ